MRMVDSASDLNVRLAGQKKEIEGEERGEKKRNDVRIPYSGKA